MAATNAGRQFTVAILKVAGLLPIVLVLSMALIYGVVFTVGYALGRASTPAPGEARNAALRDIVLVHDSTPGKFLLVHSCDGRPGRMYDPLEQRLLPLESDRAKEARARFDWERHKDFAIAVIGGASVLSLPSMTHAARQAAAARKPSGRAHEESKHEQVKGPAREGRLYVLYALAKPFLEHAVAFVRAAAALAGYFAGEAIGSRDALACDRRAVKTVVASEEDWKWLDMDYSARVVDRLAAQPARVSSALDLPPSRRAAETVATQPPKVAVPLPLQALDAMRLCLPQLAARAAEMKRRLHDSRYRSLTKEDYAELLRLREATERLAATPGDVAAIRTVAGSIAHQGGTVAPAGAGLADEPQRLAGACGRITATVTVRPAVNY